MEKKKSKLQNILAHLRAEDLDRVERSVSAVREAFQCPATVATAEEAEDVLVKFYAHYAQMRYGSFGEVYVKCRSLALNDIERLVGGFRACWDLEREAVYGPRSVIQIVDFLAERMVRFDLEMYVDRMFSEAGVDLGDTYDMAEEMVAKFGAILSLHPHFHYTFLVFDRKKFQNHVLQLALQLRTLHTEWVLDPKK